MFSVRRFLTSTLLALSLFLPFAVPVKAQETAGEGYTNIMSEGLIFANICTNRSKDETTGADACKCRAQGDCSLSDMLQIFVNISVAILGVCGSLALLIFFYGGVVWITAMGEAKKIALGKEIITKAVIGLAIIFGSYAFINFLIAGLAGNTPSSTLEETIDNAVGNQTTGDDGVDAKSKTIIESH